MELKDIANKAFDAVDMIGKSPMVWALPPQARIAVMGAGLLKNAIGGGATVAQPNEKATMPGFETTGEQSEAMADIVAITRNMSDEHAQQFEDALRSRDVQGVLSVVSKYTNGQMQTQGVDVTEPDAPGITPIIEEAKKVVKANSIAMG